MRGFLVIPLWILGPLLVVVLPALATGVQAFIRKRWPLITTGDHNDVAGFLIAVVGVMYAVVLAFCVIVTWERFDQAGVLVESEASELRVVLRDTAGLPPAVRTTMHDLVVSYAKEVAGKEWEAMDAGRRSDRAFELFGQMFSALARAETTSSTEAAFLGHALDRLDEVSDARIKRLDASREGIPGVLWAAILVGAVLTMGFALLFGVSNERLHYLMIGLFTAVITLQIFVVLVLNYPFSGQTKVSPKPFEEIVADFR